MNTNLYISVLLEHGEYIRKLSTEMSEKLRSFEQALVEPQSPGGPEAESLLAGVVELNNSLFAATDFFR